MPVVKLIFKFYRFNVFTFLLHKVILTLISYLRICVAIDGRNLPD